jgi:hypothetical protein
MYPAPQTKQIILFNKQRYIIDLITVYTLKQYLMLMGQKRKKRCTEATLRHYRHL